MASAQVLPNSVAPSRKQEHLEAGKRRLEEFRKRKAAVRAKKAVPVSTSHICNPDNRLNEKQPSEIEYVRVIDLDGVSTSDGIGQAVIDRTTVGMNNVRIPDLYTQSSDEDSLAGRCSPARDHINELSMGLLKTHANFNDDKHNNASSLTGWADVSQNKGSYQLNDIHDTHARSSVGVLYGVKNNQTNLLCLKENQEVDSNTSQSGIHGINDTQSRKSNGFLEDHPVTDHGYSPYFPSKVLPQDSVDTLPQIKSVNPAS